MKIYPVLNQTPHHEDVWESDGTVTCIFNLSTWWRQLVRFMPWLLHLQERNPITHLIGVWVGSRAKFDAVSKRKNPCPCWESDSGHPVHSSVTILTEPTSVLK